MLHFSLRTKYYRLNWCANKGGGNSFEGKSVSCLFSPRGHFFFYLWRATQPCLTWTAVQTSEQLKSVGAKRCVQTREQVKFQRVSRSPVHSRQGDIFTFFKPPQNASLEFLSTWKKGRGQSFEGQLLTCSRQVDTCNPLSRLGPWEHTMKVRVFISCSRARPPETRGSFPSTGLCRHISDSTLATCHHIPLGSDMDLVTWGSS